MNEADVTRIYEQYGRRVLDVLPPIGGYRNMCYPARTEQGTLNLIVYKREPGILERIRRTNLLGQRLHEHGVPVRFPADRRIVRLNPTANWYASLYNYLPGETIPWEAFTKKHIKLLGWILSDVHGVTREHAELHDKYPRVTDEYRTYVDRMEAYFSDQQVVGASDRKLGLRVRMESFADLRMFLRAADALPGQTVLHMDLLRGNVLFGRTDETSRYAIDDVALTGVVDLEKAALGHPLFDIARTLAFLIVDSSTKSPGAIRSYLIDSGYNKRGKSRVKQIRCGAFDVLHTATQLFLLYDFYKFLRQNPYEDLADNHHFRKTRDILLTENLLY